MKKALCALVLALGLGCSPKGSPAWQTVEGYISQEIIGRPVIQAVMFLPGYEVPSNRYLLEVDGGDDIVIRTHSDLKRGDRVKVELGQCQDKIPVETLDLSTGGWEIETSEYWLCNAKYLEKQ